MGNIIAVTGPRKLTPRQQQQAKQDLTQLLGEADYWHIGDATGLDELAQQLLTASGTPHSWHSKDAHLPWRAQGAERSTRMVRALAQTGGTLHAWPNKPAPAGLKPNGRNWPRGAQGSGTWGTIALAVGCGLKVELHPLAELGQLPDWLSTPEPQQMALALVA